MTSKLSLTPKWSRPDGRPSTDPRRLCHNADGRSDCPRDAMLTAFGITDRDTGRCYYVFLCPQCAEGLG